MIFQPEVVQDGLCSDCVNSGKVHSGTVLILGNPEWSVFRSMLIHAHTWCCRVGSMMVRGDNILRPSIDSISLRIAPDQEIY